MAGSSNVFSSSTFGASQVNERKAHLMKSKKLVLVLDLDNTLIHSKEFPLTKEASKHRKYRMPGIQLMDPVKHVYHIWAPGFSYSCKMRPFLNEFISEALECYELYWYTAATRIYGEMVVDVLRLEIGDTVAKT